jgi:DNA-binding CsgD family transcriptional regulator
MFCIECIDLSLREGYILRMLVEGMLERTYETKRK